MKLLKWETGFMPKFPNIVEKFFGKKFTDDTSNGGQISTLPSVNISDADKAFEVNVALPGLEKKDVRIEIQDNCLVVSSEKEFEKEEKERDWLRREYGYASFQRMFELPESADQEKVQAQMKNGILTIKIAKKEGFKNSVRQIAVV